MGFEVVEPGLFSTLQDAGRYGYERFGVPVSGPMDWYAFTCANRLVDNPIDAAAVEYAYQGPTLVASQHVLVAVCGDCTVRLDRVRLPAWSAIRVSAGQTLEIDGGTAGCWGYLAVSGGFAAPLSLGSRSTYLRGGFGGIEGRVLRAGDWLESRAQGATPWHLAGSRIDAEAMPVCQQALVARVVPGPQADWFDERAMQVLLGEEFHLSLGSDRMGYRLEGEAIPRRSGEILSEGMPMGAIQVPPDGKPIVMMADRPPTGGYPKIGSVIRADLPALAQMRPGEGRVRFRLVSVADAQKAYREMVRQIEIDTDADERWMSA